MCEIRLERPSDTEAVHRINHLAFGRPAEADLVDIVRAACPEALSLVAVADAEVVGHLLFSPVSVGAVQGMGLAPVAVRPSHQNRGVGSRLIRAGIEILRDQTCPFIIVLGHPGYYPRFGFVPASQFGIASQWENVPEEAFMVLILDTAVMDGVTGVARYRSEFDQVT
jgi:putative acetyltransferase